MRARKANECGYENGMTKRTRLAAVGIVMERALTSDCQSSEWMYEH